MDREFYFWVKSYYFYYFTKSKLTSELSLTFDFSLNCAKLATLPRKAYMRKNKINSAKKLPPGRIEPMSS